MTPTTLKVLVVDASPSDAELTIDTLSRGGFQIDWRRVDSASDMAAALRSSWDVILSESWVPEFSGFDALSLARSADPDTPFIIVARNVDPELEVEILRAGARDCVAKTRLFRLVPAIDRELRDAHDRRAWRRADLELRQMSRVVEQIPSVVMITDTAGTIEYVNSRFTELSGYPPEDVVGRNARLLKSGATPTEEYRRLWEEIGAGNDWRGTFHQRRRDGSTYEEEATIRPVRDASGRVTRYLKVGEDVTARHLRERQVRQAQKMEAVGRLAGGIAHDFNNLLTVISGFTELAITGLETDDPLYDELQQVAMAAERGASLTRQLLAFSRRRDTRPEPVVLASVVRQAEPMVRRLAGERVATEVRTAGDDVGTILAEPGEIERILKNLVLNAVDAMPGGGTLTIATSVRSIAAESGSHLPVAPGTYAVLSVSDTGNGMSPDTLVRIFEPFFTTGRTGKESGLGLSTAYAIVSRLGGAIDVDSEEGKGSRFDVLLPLTAENEVGKREKGHETKENEEDPRQG